MQIRFDFFFLTVSFSIIKIWCFPLRKIRFYNQVSNLPKKANNNKNNNQAFIKISPEKIVLNVINCTLVSI